MNEQYGYEIKSEKQSNGLWGTPQNCIGIGKDVCKKYELMFSAVLAGMCQAYDSYNIEVVDIDNEFGVMFYDVIDKKNNEVIILGVSWFDDYELSENILLYVGDTEDRIKKKKEIENIYESRIDWNKLLNEK